MERVLQVVGVMNRGGLETLIMSVYRRIDRTAVQFDFLTHREQQGDYDDEIRALGGNIYRLPAPSIVGIWRYLHRLDRFFAQRPYRVVHGHMDSTAALYLRAAKRHGAQTLIAHSHSTSAEGRLKKLLTNAAHIPLRSVANRYIACSREAGVWLFGKEAMHDGRVKVLPNAINAEAFRFNEDTRKRMRAELGLLDKIVFGHAGRFAEVKNHAFLLDAFRLIKDKLPNAALLLLGEGPLMDSMRQKAQTLGLSDSVTFARVRPNVPDYLQAMDVFLFPSLFEGIPLALVETQAAGLPCLAANTISTESRITDLLEFLPINSAETWANRAIALASALPPRRDMADAIRASGYDIAAVAQAWLNLYEEGLD